MSGRCRLLRGIFLQEFVSQNVFPIKVIRSGLPKRKMSPCLVLGLLRHGSYEGKISAQGRVYYIREIDNRRIFAVPTYWDGRAVIHWHPDQLTVGTQKFRDQRRCDLWERMLQRIPPPRSWQRLSMTTTTTATEGLLFPVMASAV